MAKHKALTPEQFPYTGPYTLPTGTGKAKGPTAEALKRAMWRLGLLPRREFDQHYNRALEAALDSWDPGGKDGYGRGRWEKIRSTRIPAGLPNAGELALDFSAVKLVQDEAGSTSGAVGEKVVQNFITEFWEKAIQARDRWHYDQGRPFQVHVDPSAGGDSDCSAMIVQAVAYAGRKAGLKVEDPSKMDFRGYGNTDFYEDDWPKVSAPYRVGDLAHFFNERHVCQCISPGNVQTALWGSNGSEAAPESFTLARYARFPNEFLYVVRPTLLA